MLAAAEAARNPQRREQSADDEVEALNVPNLIGVREGLQDVLERLLRLLEVLLEERPIQVRALGVESDGSIVFRRLPSKFFEILPFILQLVG